MHRPLLYVVGALTAFVLGMVVSWAFTQKTTVPPAVVPPETAADTPAQQKEEEDPRYVEDSVVGAPYVPGPVLLPEITEGEEEDDEPFEPVLISQSGQVLVTDNNLWGVEDGDTTDVAGDDWGVRTLGVELSTTPSVDDALFVYFRARRVPPEQLGIPRTDRNSEEEDARHAQDYFGTHLYINGIGGFWQTGYAWSPTVVYDKDFYWYGLLLPNDINGDGETEWQEGLNELEIHTWSSYNDTVARTSIDTMYFTHVPQPVPVN